MNFDQIAFMVFILLISIFLIFKRKKVFVQKLLFPLFYLIIYRTNFGLKWMDRVSEKHRNLIKLFGYCSIGLGFIGMIFVALSVLGSMISFFIAPKTTEVGMVLVLPGTTIPGIGYLSFFYFIIAIVLLAIVHEFAHGVVMRAHDIEVKSSGFAFLGVLLPIVPAAFVEPNEKKMSKREPYVQYSALSAGPISNIFLSIIFLMILMFVMAPIESRITEQVGFSFDVIEGYPAEMAGIESGTIIDSFNGEKVTNSSSFIEKMAFCTGVGETVLLGSKGVEYSLTTVSNPGDSSRGFIGVTNIESKGKPIKGFIRLSFFWFKGLFKWLYLLNLFIGLMNLLPIFITDGAKMLFVAIQGSIKSKKKALRVWSLINKVFVALILIGLFATYLKKFGLF